MGGGGWGRKKDIYLWTRHERRQKKKKIETERELDTGTNDLATLGLFVPGCSSGAVVVLENVVEKARRRGKVRRETTTIEHLFYMHISRGFELTYVKEHADEMVTFCCQKRERESRPLWLSSSPSLPPLLSPFFSPFLSLELICIMSQEVPHRRFQGKSLLPPL